MAQIKTFNQLLQEKIKSGEVTVTYGIVSEKEIEKFENYMVERKREFNVKSFYSGISAANTILTV